MRACRARGTCARRSRRARAARARAPARRRSRRRARCTCSGTRSCDRAKGDSRAWCRISFAQARPMPGDHALVAEHRVQPPRLRARRSPRARRRRGRAPPARGARAPPRPPPGVSSQTPARFFEPASVRTSCAPPSNSSRKAGAFGPFSPGAQVAEPARGHQVDEQHELAVLGREQEPLRPPPRAREPPALERRERRVERLQRRDVRRPGLHDRERAHRLVELATPGLHLRELGHLTSVVHGRQPHQGSRAARRRRRGDAPRPRRRGAGRPPRRGGRRRRPRDAPPLLGEAVPGAAARARRTTTLDPRELAIASASHLADREQLGGRADAARRALTPARTTSSAAARAIRRRGSSTTAPASTPACSPSAARTAGAPRATASRATGCSARTCDDVAAAARRRRGRDPDRGRRLRRPRRSRSRSSGWPTMFTRLEASARGQARRRRDARAPGADPRRRARRTPS